MTDTSLDWQRDGVTDELRDIARRADALMLGVIGLGAGVALWIGMVHGRPGTAAAWAGALLVLSGLAFVLARGSLLSCLVMATAGMGMVALHIQVSLGATDFHFGVFVFLAFLLAYRDWRPIVLGALLIAVHHIAFDRLQLAGLPLYCLADPDFGRILIHATFVIVQTAVEVVLAVRMRADARESAELQMLCQPQADGQLSLAVRHLSVHTPTAVALRAALLRLNDVVADVHQTASSMSTSSSEIALGNQDLSQRTERTASHLQEAAASVEQLDSVVRSSVQDAITARQLATQASQLAEQCGDVVGNVVSTMQEIQSGARRIADIVGVIDSIAFQTNLLALNAAVEAARAGEQGRGFAVVASEVRGLAGRSAVAAREVRTLIGVSLEQADRGVNLVSDAGRRMASVVECARRASQTVGAISTTVEGQSSDLGRVTSSVTEVDHMTQQNAALVEQSAAAVASLMQQATRLLHMVNGFKFQASAALPQPA